MKLKIKTKMLLYILIPSILIFSISIMYINASTRKLILNDAKKIAGTVIKNNALKIEKSLYGDLMYLKSTAYAFSNFGETQPNIWKKMYTDMAYDIYINNENFFGLSFSIENRYFDTIPDTREKRFFYHINRKHKDGNKVKYFSSIRDINNNVYLLVKSIGKDGLLPPTFDKKDNTMKAIVTAPIISNSNYTGNIVAIITSDRFKKLLNSIVLWKQSDVFLTSDNGTLLWHHDNNFYGKTIFDYHPEYDKNFNIRDNIKNGTDTVMWGTDNNNNSILLAIAPIRVGKYDAPWSLIITVPKNVILKEANKTQAWSLLVALVVLIIISVIIILIANDISSALVFTTSILKKLSKGETDNIEDITYNRGDEIEEMTQSVNILKSGLIKTSEFASEIGNGNLKAEYSTLSEKDRLGNALIEMRKNLSKAKEEEKIRKKEDEKQNWTTQGLAKFGDILRQNSGNMNELAYQLMSNLTNYMNVAVGAIYIIKEKDNKPTFLELKSTIAYERRKYMKRDILIGEGQVGRCAFEKETIYMTDIPDNYIKITSGMGTANPRHLLLVPLITNEKLYGVIELASFNKIEKYKIKFVEKLGEVIAGTIASVIISETTSTLLEQSQKQSEELVSQEEEMRQNLEELQTTREEAERREYEMNAFINAFEKTAIVVEYNTDGTIINFNNKLENILNIPHNEIIGKHHSDGYIFDEKEKLQYSFFWDDLKKGLSKTQIGKIEIDNNILWFEENYFPITDNETKTINKIIKIAYDITKYKES